MGKYPEKASLGHPFWARRPSSPPPARSSLPLPSECQVPPLLSDCGGPASPPAQAPSPSQVPLLVPPPQAHPGLQGPAAELSVRSKFHPDPSRGSVLGPQGSSSCLGQACPRAQPRGPRPEPAAFAEPPPPTQASTPPRPPQDGGISNKPLQQHPGVDSLRWLKSQAQALRAVSPAAAPSRAM